MEIKIRCEKCKNLYETKKDNLMICKNFSILPVNNSIILNDVSNLKNTLIDNLKIIMLGGTIICTNCWNKFIKK